MTEKRRLRRVCSLALLTGALAPIVLTADPAHAADFNDDGFADLAVGATGENVANAPGAGAINVLYGSATGLRARGQRLSQATLGVPDAPDADPFGGGGDRFGAAVATGDFNGDGFDDAAIGVPGELIETAAGPADLAGAVNVLYGSRAGLSGAGAQFWHQDSPGITGVPEGQPAHTTSDRFGAALAAGDLNGDGRDDLAIGVPGETIANVAGGGAVHVLFGAPGGLTAAGSRLLSQHSPGVGFTAEPEDNFGAALAIGRFDRDRFADLAVGVFAEGVETTAGEQREAGAVNVLYGSPIGPTGARDQVWHQGSPGVAGTPEQGVYGDRFGAALAAGDLNGDGRDDLAIGAPKEGFETLGLTENGVVHVLFGANAGLTAGGSQLWSQHTNDVQEAAETGDHFGSSLAIADFGRSAHDDLAIGVPLETVDAATGGANIAGAVNVLYGSLTGPTAAGNRVWHQNAGGVTGIAEYGDLFGSSLYAADFGNGSRADLAVGAPTEGLGSATGPLDRAGAVNVLYGTATAGLTSVDNEQWHENVPDVSPTGDRAEPDDRFGDALG